MTDQEKVPAGFTDEEAWLVDNRVCEIKTSYKMTGCDTSQDYVTLTSLSGKSVTWRSDTFSRIAKLASYVSSTSSLVEPKEYGLRERVQKRRAWDKANAREVSEYKRLKAKFEGATPATPPEG
jgi:hypothetical protein